jgi:trans-aconitate methyltransferase
MFCVEYYDLVYSNAALHWSQDQFIISRILKNLVTPKTGVLAVQMPDTRVQPSHTLMEVAARNCGFSKAIENARIPRVEYDPDYYFRMVSKQSRDIDMWSTEYIHQLQISPESMNHPVCTFTSATGLRPILDSIEHSGTETNNSSGGNGGTGKDRVNTFLAEYNRLLYEAYPVVYSESNNVKVPMVIFPFKRFFLIVAKL